LLRRALLRRRGVAKGGLRGLSPLLKVAFRRNGGEGAEPPKIEILLKK